MYKRTAQEWESQEWESREFRRTYGNTTWTGGSVVQLSVEMEAFAAVVIVRCRGVARGCEGCGPHQAALARERQIGENCKKNHVKFQTVSLIRSSALLGL